MISTFYKNYPKKSIAMSLPKDSALPIAKPTAKPMAKPLDIIKKKCG